jgi:hypothetical protein
MRSLHFLDGVMRRAKLALLLGALAGGAAVTSSCDDSLNARDEYLCPDKAVYTTHVSELMERRCGTLDCHGNSFRPMRLYGELSLRHQQEDNVTGGNATTDREKDANYLTVCSIEPERLSEVASDPGGQSVNQLLLVRKARGTEGHKGGKVFNAFDDADLCVVGWLRGDSDKSVAQACAKALEKLP